MKMRWIVVVVALCAPALVAWSPGKPPPPPPPPDTYVALGDSFVAGPLIPPANPDYPGCLKSLNNYPHMVAAAIATDLPNFRDVSCSGAQTKHMTETQGVDPDPDNPPQFDALSVTTGLVTLGIGGNDIGFSDIAVTCGEAFLQGENCKDTYAPPGGRDQLRDAIRDTGPKVDAVLDGIKQRAPQARILVVNYLPIFPEGPDPITGIEGCPPSMPISQEDVPYLRGIQKELNAMLAHQARANQAVLVDAYAAGIGHDSCKPPGIRWVEPAIFIPLAAPVHPNLQGMMGVAAEVVEAIQS